MMMILHTVYGIYIVNVHVYIYIYIYIYDDDNDVVLLLFCLFGIQNYGKL